MGRKKNTKTRVGQQNEASLLSPVFVESCHCQGEGVFVYFVRWGWQQRETACFFVPGRHVQTKNVQKKSYKNTKFLRNFQL